MWKSSLIFGRRLIRDLKGLSLKQWLKLITGVVGFIVISFGLSYASQLLLSKLKIPLFDLSWLGYLVVFATFLTSSAVLFVPVPFAVTILIDAALILNPLMVGLSAAVGASIGELVGYLAGVLGRKALMKENFLCSVDEIFCNENLHSWVQKRGPLAIGIIAAQPILPFDVAGIIAGSLGMSVPRFFLAMAAGKTIKYLVLAYASGILSTVPWMK